MSMPDETPFRSSFTPRRKWGVGFDLFIRTLAVGAVLVLLNFLAGTFFHRQYLSETTKTELSPRTHRVIESITNKVEVTIYYDRQDEFYPAVAGLLREYQALNPNINVTTVDYFNDAADAVRIKREFKLPEATKEDERNFVLFKSGTETRVIPGNVLTDTQVEIDQEHKTYRRRAIAFKGETAFTAMILAVTSPQPLKAYVLQGHGEHDIDSGDELRGYLDFKSLLQQNAVKVEPLELGGTNMVPADCNLLVVAGPRSVIPPITLAKISQYLDEGGRLFALFNYEGANQNSGLEQLLAAKWNVLVTDGVVQDPANALNSIKATPGADVTVGVSSQHPAVRGLINYNLNFFPPRVVGKKPSDQNTADAPTITELLKTADTARLVNYPALAPTNFPLAVAVERRSVPGVATGRGNTRMIIVGDSFFLANEHMKFLANRDFAHYALNWLLDRPQFTAGIGPKPFVEFRVVLTEKQMGNLSWLLLGAVPGSVLLFGVLVWWRRRK